MGIKVELNAGEYTRCYSRKLLQCIARKAVDASRKVDGKIKNITISVAIVDEDEIQRVNREFRGKDHVTDVISVGDYSDNRDITSEEEKEIFLGEVILCYNYIIRSAQENGVSADEEFFSVYVHGILHLLGFVHGKKMFLLQDAIVGDVNSCLVSL
jgi:probable rRNA maturation factor